MMKDNMENLSFTIKSRDDPFSHNQGFTDYSFANLDVSKDWDQWVTPSPITRRMKAREVDRQKTPIHVPEKGVIDWDKIEYCPWWRQKLPDNKDQVNKDYFKQGPEFQDFTSGDATAKYRLRKSRFNQAQPINVKTENLDDMSESEDSEYKATQKAKNLDDNANKRRKSKAQVKMLEEELEANPHWTNDDMVKIAKKTGLSKSQVYKWNWDQKKKLNILPSKVYVVQLPGDLVDPKTGQIVLRSPDELKKLQKLNIESLIQKTVIKK